MTTATPEETAAIKDAARRAGDAVHAATQAPMTDPAAWWLRIADAEDTYAEALHRAAGLYFTDDQFAYGAIGSLSWHVHRTAQRDRQKANAIATEIALRSKDLEGSRLGGAG